MAIETEAKFEIEPSALAGIRSRLVALGARQVSRPLVEENLLFDFPDRKLGRSGCMLRIRRYGSQTLLTFKGPVRPDPRLKKREEIQTLVEDGDALHHVIEQLGMVIFFRYSKTREMFELSHEEGVLQVCLDVTAAGTFVELEGSPEAIDRVASEFGWTDFIQKSYIELLRERGL